MLDLGIVVKEYPLDFFADEFIRCTCPAQDHPARIEVTWRVPPRWVTQNQEKLSLRYGISSVDSKPYRLHLISFPKAIPKDFSLVDLEVPFTVAGMILIVDLNNRQFWQERAPTNSLKAIKTGKIDWTRTSHLPTVIAAISNHPFVFGTDEIPTLLGLDAQTPFIPYFPDTYDEENLRLNYPFVYTQQVLSALVEQIEANL